MIHRKADRASAKAKGLVQTSWGHPSLPHRQPGPSDCGSPVTEKEASGLIIILLALQTHMKAITGLWGQVLPRGVGEGRSASEERGAGRAESRARFTSLEHVSVVPDHGIHAAPCSVQSDHWKETHEPGTSSFESNLSLLGIGSPPWAQEEELRVTPGIRPTDLCVSAGRPGCPRHHSPCLGPLGQGGPWLFHRAIFMYSGMLILCQDDGHSASGTISGEIKMWQPFLQCNCKELISLICKNLWKSTVIIRGEIR